MSAIEKVSCRYYLRDAWVDVAGFGRVIWARRGDWHSSLKTARAEARRLAKGIGKGARVQIVRVSSEVVVEVVE